MSDNKPTPKVWVLVFEGFTGDTLRVYDTEPSNAAIATAVSAVCDETIRPGDVKKHLPGKCFATVTVSLGDDGAYDGELWHVDRETGL